MKIHRAPWHRRFKTLWCKGQFAYEVQIGPVVLQWFYEPFHASRFPGKRLHIWKDWYWR